MRKPTTEEKLIIGIVLVSMLSGCLVLTTLELTHSGISVTDNAFHTGAIHINLNDGSPLIQEHEILFQPGMTVERDFFIENSSTDSVYYRLYFDDLSGELANVLTITIKDGDDILYCATADQLTRTNAIDTVDVLYAGQRKNLTVLFYFPEDKENSAQNMSLQFTIHAEAIQAQAYSYQQYSEGVYP